MHAFETFLEAQGHIGPSDLERVQRYVREQGASLHDALLQSTQINPRTLAAATAQYYGLPVVTEDMWPQALAFAPELSLAYLRAHKIVPLAVAENQLVIAVADPSNTSCFDAVRVATRRTLQLRVAPAADIEAALDRMHPSATPRTETEVSTTASGNVEDVEQLKDLALGAPVVRIVNQLVSDALSSHATDIHIEPGRQRLSVRMRVDGLLREVRSPPNDLARAIVSRIKLLAGLDIAQRRLPQDGRIRMMVVGRQVDIRVATVPTINGEAVAMRLLDTSRRSLELSALGFNNEQEAILRHHLAAPYGLILVTGPTGSGKTTTLASALSILNEPVRKILTVEDPIEYQIDGINQTQVKPEIGMTFAHTLRSFLRHDPDVMMVGELRDTETARIAVQAALTGHLVLATLHTNSAPGAVTRLLDMGIDTYLLASSVRCIIGQRLVRVLCSSCREAVEQSIDLPDVALHQAGLRPGQPVSHWQARGCGRCSGTGYAGRTGLVELFVTDEAIRSLIKPGVDLNVLTKAAVRAGMRSLMVDGIGKSLTGITTPDEVRRVALES